MQKNFPQSSNRYYHPEQRIAIHFNNSDALQKIIFNQRT